MSREKKAGKTLLLATDFSQSSTGATKFAFELAGCMGAELYLVHGIEPIAGAEDGGDGDFDEFFEELAKKSKKELEKLVSRAEEEGITARFHIEIGQRWKIVLAQAEEAQADLVVLGRRMYREDQEVSLGTTSQRVFFGSNRPVLVVPREESEEQA